MIVSSHDEVGGTATTKFTACAEQYGLIAIRFLCFVAGLYRMTVGEGFATIQATIGVATLMATDDRRKWSKAGLHCIQL